MKKKSIGRKKLNRVAMLAYGEMAPSAIKSLTKLFNIKFIVTPSQNPNLYRRLEELEVEKLARKKGIKIVQTSDNKEIEKIVRMTKPDALVIASYNKVLPKSLLNLTKCINVHHGDLPNWRGRANFNWAIIMGLDSVGLTVHNASADLDAGNIYKQYTIPISKYETITTLYAKANKLIEKDLGRVVKMVIDGYEGKPQKGEATYCCTRLPEDGYIDWSLSSVQIDRLIRALTKPFPGAFTYFEGEKMNVWSSEIPKNPLKYVARIPGRIIKIHKGLGVEVLTGDSSIILKEVTYGGKNGRADGFINTVMTSLGFSAIEAYELLKTKLGNINKP